METINDITAEMREFADIDACTIGRDVLRRKIQHFARRIDEATANCSQLKRCEVLKRIVSVCADAEVTDCQAREIAEDLAGEALATPPRNCDVMTLETARKVWFAKEIIPRLRGDLPLGKEIPFEEWFVSQVEQESKGNT